MARVVVLEPQGYSPVALETYASLGTVCAHPLREEERMSVCADAEVFVVKLGKVTAELMALAPKLRVIASPTTGLDHIDLAAAERRGVKIVSLKGKRELLDKIFATSELTVTLILSLLRFVPAAHRHVLGGSWNRQVFIGREVSGKTVGIVGCGRLGARVAIILQAMGARVIATDPYQAAERIPAGVTLVSLNELLDQSDIVTVHVDLRPENEKMFGTEQFTRMKPGAYFINTSRGQMVDETALLQALTSGHLGGAALDVMQGEDADGRHLEQNSLVAYARTHANLLFTPHLGGATWESMGVTEEAIAREVVQLLQTS